MAWAVANGSMGVTLIDMEGNQRFDLMVNNFEHEQIAFYRNEGGSMFRYASRDVGLSTLDCAAWSPLELLPLTSMAMAMKT